MPKAKLSICLSELQSAGFAIAKDVEADPGIWSGGAAEFGGPELKIGSK